MLVSYYIILISVFYSDGFASVIIGGGSSLPFSLFTKWSFSFLDVIPRITVKYSVSNGLIGLSGVLKGDIMYSGAFKLRSPMDTIYQFPICGSAIVILYNLPNMTIPLRLDRQAMIDIFLGNISQWRDPHLMTLNPFLQEVEDKPIQIYLGLNTIPISYLTTAFSQWSPTWNSTYGIISVWPPEMLSATKAILLPTSLNTLMTSYIQATPYSLTFGLLSDSFDIGVSYAVLVDENNNTIDAALSGDVTFDPSIPVDIKNFGLLTNDTINLPGSWPIIGLTFGVIPLYPTFSCSDYSDMLKFFIWALTSDTADVAANRSGYMPIEESVSLKVAQYLMTLKCRGSPTYNRTIQPKDITSGGALLCLIVSYLGMVVLPIMTHYSWGDNRVTRMFHGSLSCASFMALLSITFSWLEPTDIICQIRIWLFGIGATMVMASVFNYMWRFYLVNKTVEEKKWNKKIPIFQTTLASMIIILVLEVILLAVWTALDPFLQQFVVIDVYDQIGTYSCASNQSSIWISTQYAFFFALNLWGIYAVTVTWTLQTKQVRWVIMSIYTTFVTMIVLFVYTQLAQVDDLELLYVSTVFVMVVAIGFNVSLLLPKVIEAHSSESSLKREKTTSDGSLKMLRGSRGTLSEEVNDVKERSKKMVSVVVPRSIGDSEQDREPSMV